MTPPPSNPLPPTSPVTPTPAVGAPAQNNTKATIALVLGILSLVCCGFFAGIPALILGRSECKAIDEGRSPESNRTIAKLGWILGLVGTILSVLGALIYVGIIAMAIMQSGAMKPSTF
ncbi:MAG: DUF4190 domain-containing protein [Deltaproteobacteria bacterium]|nr:DUF4190 domain-containing protein [Deltaproteobacteria bacterium]